MTRLALRGHLLDLTGDPHRAGPAALRSEPDGLLMVEHGRIVARGPAVELLDRLTPDVELVDRRGDLILPGFIDAHIHYPQARITGSYGAQLLDWLERYTFPEELRFFDPAYAEAAARFFLDELLRNGTTAALVYCTTHPQSVEALFAAAEPLGMRLIAGKVMMDRGAPAGLLDTAERGAAESAALIARWHGRGRLGYAITPRFAVTSTAAQLAAAGELLATHPGCWLQTHLSENAAEIAAVARLFPDARDYTDVYDRHGLLGPRTLLGHCIHLTARERARLAATGSIAVFCPTSNLFIGSGLFDLRATRAAALRTALATDIGGGTSFSMLRTAAAGYTVQQLQGLNWPAAEMLWAMTLGNAEALGLAEEIGSLEPGRSADLVILDPRATPLLARRCAAAASVDELLFALVTLGDDRAVRATYLAGRQHHARPAERS